MKILNRVKEINLNKKLEFFQFHSDLTRNAQMRFLDVNLQFVIPKLQKFNLQELPYILYTKP